MPIPWPVLDGFLVDVGGVHIGLRQLAINSRPGHLEAPLAFLKVAGLAAVRRQLRLAGKSHTPIPRFATADAGHLQDAADRDAVPDHNKVVSRGLARDDGFAEGELVSGRDGHAAMIARQATRRKLSIRWDRHLSLATAP
jgi:hypothetical protein